MNICLASHIVLNVKIMILWQKFNADIQTKNESENKIMTRELEAAQDNGRAELRWVHVFWIRMNCRRIIKGKQVTLQQLSDRLDKRFGVSVSQKQVSFIIRNERWVDPNWDPSNRAYIVEPEGWEESWGEYNA